MSDQTDTQYRDRRLSDTYKALADERAPDHLSDRVLRLAAGETPYSRARAWTRPLAWAATIGLSLAIVLELNRLPPETPDAIAVPAPDDALIGERHLNRKEPVTSEAASLVPASGLPTASVTDSQRTVQAMPPADRGDSVIKDEFAPQEDAILRGAEDMARAQSESDQGTQAIRAEPGDKRAGAGPAEEVTSGLAGEIAETAETDSADKVSVGAPAGKASFATLENTENRPPSRNCGESRRHTPEAWLDCIRELEKAGREDEARIEYEEFRRVFPDYDE